MKELLDEIELRRKALVYIGMQLGFQHPAVIDFSQDLDELIVEVQKERLTALFFEKHCSTSTECR